MSSIIVVQDQGIAGPPGPQGPQGAAGTPGTDGVDGSGFYIHQQLVPDDVWTITHNLGFHPAITVVDSAGTVVEGDVQYLDVNTAEITFSAPFGGSAYLS